MRRSITSTVMLAIAIAVTLAGSAFAEESKPQLTVTYYYLPG